MKKYVSKFGILVMLVATLFIITGCGENKAENKIVNDIKSDAILYRTVSGGEFIGKYEYHLCLNEKKLIYIDKSKVVPFTTEKEREKNNEEKQDDTRKEYNLNQEQINKFKELIKQTIDKNEQTSSSSSKVYLNVDGKEYVVDNYGTEWDKLIKSIII